MSHKHHILLPVTLESRDSGALVITLEIDMNTLAGALAVKATKVIEAQAALIVSLQGQVTAVQAFIPDAEDSAAETALQAAVDAAGTVPTPTPAPAQQHVVGRPPVVSGAPAVVKPPTAAK